MAEETKKVLLDISINSDQFIQKIVLAKDKIALLKKENTDLNKEAKLAFEGGLLAEFDTLTRKIVENENAQKVSRTELSRGQKQLEAYTLATKATAGSYEELYQQWKLSESVLKNLEGTLKRNADGTIELTEEFVRAKEETQNAKNALNEFGLGVKDGRLNVGNYAASLEGALDKFPAFSEGLTLIKGGLSGVKTGFELAKGGVDLFNQGTAGLSESFSTFTQSLSGSMGQVKEFATNIGKVKEEVPGVTAVGAAGKVAASGLNVASGAAKVFRLALISTGIGALVVAVGALVAFFAKTKEGADKIEVAFGAIGGLVGSLIKSFAGLGKMIFEAFSNPKKAIEELMNIIANPIDSIQRLTSGLAETGRKAAAAAAEMAKITKEQQILDDVIRENLALNTEAEGKIKAILAATKDQSLADADRLAKLKEAGVIEEQLEKRKLSASVKQLELLDREIAIKGLDDEKENKRAELANEIAKVKADSLILTSQLRAKEARFEQELLKASLDGEKQLADAKIKNAELLGQNTTGLRVEAAKLERDSLLTQEGLTADQILAIRLDFQNKMLEIDKQGFEKRQALSDELRDIAVSRIVDDQTREIEQEKTTLERRLREITGNSAQERQLKTELLNQSLLEIQAIITKFDEQSQAERSAKLKVSVDQQVADIEQGEGRKLAALELAAVKELGAIQVRIANGEASQADLEAAEQGFNERRFQIEQEALTQKLELQTVYYATQKINEQVFYQDQVAALQESFNNELISITEFNAKMAELDKLKRETDFATELESKGLLTSSLNALDDLRLRKTIETEKGIVTAKTNSAKSQKAINNELLVSSASLLGDLSKLIAADEEGRKKNAGVIKALAIGEVIINAQREISGFFTGAGKDAASYGVYGGIPAAAVAAARAISTGIRAAISISTISSQKFAGGGMTKSDGVPVPIMNAISQYSPNILNDFQGGRVDKPTMWNLAGEAGSEYVAPAWQLQAAPALFSQLDSWRKTKVRPFADGGFTQAQFAGQAIQSQTQEASFNRALSNMPPIFVTVEDFNTVQNRVNVLESRSSI